MCRLGKMAYFNRFICGSGQFQKNGKEDMNDEIRRRIKVGCEG